MAQKRRRRQTRWQRQYKHDGLVAIVGIVVMAAIGLAAIHVVSGSRSGQVLAETSTQCAYDPCIGYGSLCSAPTLLVSCDDSRCNTGPCVAPGATATPTPTPTATPTAIPVPNPTTPVVKQTPVLRQAPDARTSTDEEIVPNVSDVIERFDTSLEPTDDAEDSGDAISPTSQILEVGSDAATPVTFFATIQSWRTAIAGTIQNVFEFFRTWRGVAN